jgi:flagellar protein FliO/FliZ
MIAAWLSQFATLPPPHRRQGMAGPGAGTRCRSQRCAPACGRLPHVRRGAYLAVLLALPAGLILPAPAATAATLADAPIAQPAIPTPAPAGLAGPADSTGARPASGADAHGAATGVFTDAEWRSGAPAGSDAHHDAADGAALSPAHAAGGLAVALCVVLAVIGLGALAVRRWGSGRGRPGAGRHLQVLDTLSVAPKRMVLALRVADRVLIVGVGVNELHALADLPASAFAVAADPLPGGTPPPADPVPPFARTLASYLGQEP